MLNRSFVALAAFAAGMFVAQNSFAVVAYTVTDLGTFGGPNSTALGLNAAGHVAGQADTAYNGGYYHAFYYDGVTQHNLGTLGTGDFSVAYGINDNNVVAGMSRSVAGGDYYPVISTNGGALTQLNVFGGSAGTAYAINNSTQITGDYSLYNGNYDGFVSSGGAGGGTFTSIAPLAGYGSSAGEAINASGILAGQSYNPDTPQQRAFKFASGTVTDLGTLGGAYSAAYGINDSGAIVGSASVNATAHHAAYWAPGATTPTNLGTLGGTNSIAQGINSSGVIVGTSDTSVNGIFAAFVDVGGVMTNLNSLIDPASGWQLDHAYQINATGQIIGDGEYRGNTNGFLLTPVPEPSAAALITVTLCGFSRRRRRA